MSSLLPNGQNQPNGLQNEIPMLLPTNMNGGQFGGDWQIGMNQGQYSAGLGGSGDKYTPAPLLGSNSNNLDDFQDDFQQQDDYAGGDYDEDMGVDDDGSGGNDANKDGGNSGGGNSGGGNSGGGNSGGGSTNSNGGRRGGGGRGRNGGGNRQSNHHTGNRGQPAVFISAEGSPRTYAAKIAEHVRDGQPPILMAAGANSINQATKSLAYAREYLASDGLDLSAQPEYRQREEGGLTRSTTALSFQCIILQLPKVTSIMDVELKVSKRSDPNTIAGAIAGKCREHLRVGIQSIGPVCTVRAVSAIAIARRYLVNDGQDLRFRPEFISCDFEEGSSCMGLRLTILQMQV
jgi:stage V sporulation protein SpoVS